MKIRDLIEATKACVFNNGNLNFDVDVNISTDTRTIQKGDIYLPLKGANFDGEKFIEQAIEKGAIGAFCTKEHKIFPRTLKEGEEFLTEQSEVRNSGEGTSHVLLQVPDTLIAYLQIANFWRRKQDYIVVAITGSSGKTTTKEIVASVLESKYKVFKTPLNHNNEIGLCQTILSAPFDTEVLVLEMGMRGLGEIELLSQYAEPDITIVSNVGTAHIGRLGSRENIAKAKCEIVKYQRGDIFIAHDDELIKNTVNFNGTQIYYSLKNVNIIEKRPDYSCFKYKNDFYEINVGGDYNIENALAAIYAGEKLNLTKEQIQKGLEKYRPIEKRWEAVYKNGFEIINDSYNANPESMKAFINTVFELYNDYLLVLGDMGELGENEVMYHKELGEYIMQKNPAAKIISIGSLSKNITDECNGMHFETIDNAVDYIKTNIKKTTKIFLKASRSMKFEKIIELLD